MIGMGTTIFLVNPQTFGGGGGSYLVDTYSPVIAFSVRKISSTATNCLRVRRDSDNAEQDIGFSGNDLDTSSLSTFVGANSAYVTKWYNQGTGGATYDVSQTSASDQPRIVNAGTIETENSKTAIAPLGSADSLDVVISDAGTYVSTFAITNITNTNARVWTTDGASSGLRNTAGNNVTARASSDVTIVGTGTAQGQTIYSTFGTSSCSTYYNGNTGGTGNIGSNYIGTLLTIGGDNGTTGMTGTLQEIIIFTTDESSNRTDIESDINTYYSIY